MSKKRIFNPKLFISIMTLIMSIVVCITATYAWFQFPTQNWVSDISIEVTQGKAVELSIDGMNFSNTLTALDAKKAIVIDYKGWAYEEQNDGTYILKDSSGKVIDDSNLDYEKLFKSFTLSPVTSLDGVNFYTRDNKSVDRTEKGAYINLPLYGKLNSKVEEGGVSNYRDLYLNNVTQYTGSGSTLREIKPTQITGEDISIQPLNSFTMYDDLGNPVKINTNDTITVNPVNAMRIAINSDYNSSIFEPYLGLGSYAVDYTNYKASKYNLGASSIDSTKNAAFTHYNNIVSTSINPLSFDSYKKLETNLYHNFDNVDSLNICTINGDTPTKFYVTIWLEGYDADCLDYLNSKEITIDLSFTVDGISNDRNNILYNFRDGSELQIVNKLELNNTISPNDLDVLYVPYEFRQRNYFLYWSFDRLTPIEDTQFSKDVILYAVWGLDMSFILDGGVIPEITDSYISGTVIVPPTPEKIGFTFAGWYTDKDLTIPYVSKTLYNGIDLYAAWVEN